MGGLAIGTGIIQIKQKEGLTIALSLMKAGRREACLWYLWECLEKATFKLTYP